MSKSAYIFPFAVVIDAISITMTHLHHWMAVVNVTWFLATEGGVASPKYLSTAIVPEHQPPRALSLKKGDLLRLRCDSTASFSLNVTFAWFFKGLPIPSSPRPGLYRYKVAVARQAGRHPQATPYSTLDMGHCHAAHAGIYSCQIVVEGAIVGKRWFEVRVTASTRQEADTQVVSGHDPLTPLVHVPVALSFRGLPRRPLVGRTRWSSPSRLVDQACDNDEVCADTDPVSLCEGGVCICAPTFTLEGTHCIKRVGRYQRCGAQVVCRGSSMICNEGFCECSKEIGERDDECGVKGPRSTLSLIMIYTSIAITLFAIVFVLFYAFCQKRYDINDDLKGAFIVTCVIL
ncbi:hypothetical protein HPB50_024649 [Hyalomma asiaticum]|uniref:Uncharacterized protein n=1 Tax=Hyalomma asiaticum TaxID=266040 RepID=A0ACB7T262_HYAAI|nr:hypothetical protein HPB50_024649 [Hyalomma asiaticum]